MIRGLLDEGIVYSGSPKGALLTSVLPPVYTSSFRTDNRNIREKLDNRPLYGLDLEIS